MTAPQIPHKVTAAYENLARPARQRLNDNARIRIAACSPSRAVEHRASARQYLWPALAYLSFSKGGDRRGGAAARGRYALKDDALAANGGHEDDGPILSPPAAAAIRRVAKRDCRAPSYGDFLQLAGGKKANPMAIRREKWVGGILCARNRCSLQLV